MDLSLSAEKPGLPSNASESEVIDFLDTEVQQSRWRARVATAGLLDGTYIIDLLGVPDAPLAAIDRTALPFAVLPDAPAAAGDAMASAQSLMARIGNLPLEEVMTSTTTLLDLLAIPDYAVASEMTVQDQDGMLRMQKRQLRAVKPSTANTQLLAKEISDQSKATAIVEHWPPSDPAGRRLEVRIADIYADTLRRFKLTVALADGSFGGLVAAQSQALRDLARDISQLK